MLLPPLSDGLRAGDAGFTKIFASFAGFVIGRFSLLFAGFVVGPFSSPVLDPV
jgi:hypothetical protein